MVPKATKEKALALRDAGHSYKFIEAKLGIRRSTLSGWFSGRPYNPNHYTLEKIRNGPKLSAQIRIRGRIERTQMAWSKAKEQLGELTPRDLFMLGVGLYMGEGSKTDGIIRFSNSDPSMVKIFIFWMKSHFGLSDLNFALRVHSYPDVDTIKIERYWLKITGLPKSCLRRTFIDTRKKISAKSGKLPYGTAHITICAAGNTEFGVHLSRLIHGYTIAVFEKYAGIV